MTSFRVARHRMPTACVRVRPSAPPLSPASNPEATNFLRLSRLLLALSFLFSYKLEAGGVFQLSFATAPLSPRIRKRMNNSSSLFPRRPPPLSLAVKVEACPQRSCGQTGQRLQLEGLVVGAGVPKQVVERRRGGNVEGGGLRCREPRPEVRVCCCCQLCCRRGCACVSSWVAFFRGLWFFRCTAQRTRHPG